MRKLQTGDLILFSGQCKVGKLIRLLSWSKWSHVGIIINDDTNHGIPLLYESTHNDTIKGLDNGKHNQGVQIVPFKDRLDQYKGDIAIRRVINPDYSQRHQLRLYRTKMTGTPFETNIIELIASAKLFKWLRGDEDLSSVFCSEHVAQASMSLGWLTTNKPSNHYCPKFFSVNNTWLNGVSYSKVELMKKYQYMRRTKRNNQIDIQ